MKQVCQSSYTTLIFLESLPGIPNFISMSFSFLRFFFLRVSLTLMRANLVNWRLLLRIGNGKLLLLGTVQSLFGFYFGSGFGAGLHEGVDRRGERRVGLELLGETRLPLRVRREPLCRRGDCHARSSERRCRRSWSSRHLAVVLAGAD